jgi:hypothetical protein
MRQKGFLVWICAVAAFLAASMPVAAVEPVEVVTKNTELASKFGDVSEQREGTLRTLKRQLRRTKSVGLVTKLLIKFRIDGLIDDFKVYHDNDEAIELAQLRRRFDHIIDTVDGLVREDDPALANFLIQAEPDLWALLINPKRFSDL